MGNKLLLALAASSLFFFFQVSHDAFAASATMNLSPQSGSFGKQFSVNLTINGDGEKFNAAQSTVSLSYGLAIKDLVLGDCNFSFIKMPSTQDPSFAGIIPSTYSTKCTVYTLTLVPTAKTNATITLTKVQVKRYGDAANILSASAGGSYTLTAALKAADTSILQSLPPSNNSLYSVNINVLSGKTSVSNATVVLNSVSDKKQQQITTDRTGHAIFKDLQSGFYDAVIMESHQKVGESILNVSGQNHVLTFGIDIKGQQNNPILKNTGSVLGLSTSSPYFIVAILGIGVILGTALTFILIKIRKTRSMPA